MSRSEGEWAYEFSEWMMKLNMDRMKDESVYEKNTKKVAKSTFKYNKR